uniref:Uncharacterized protein n=1 Tax=viral metagenome TaxID=1070528 RepID=A0A6C0D0L4_9ZZZZ
MNNYYNSTSYLNKINTKQVLILDIDDQYEKNDKFILGSSDKFHIKLHEPIIIDNISELYLDNVTTYNCNISNDNDNSAFILNIDQFNSTTKVASNSSYTYTSAIGGSSSRLISNGNNIIANNIIIPNENNDLGNYFSSVHHKSKKLNYLADIPCGRIDQLSGNITNLHGDSIFHGQQNSNNYTYMIQNINWLWNGQNNSFSGSDAGIDFPGSSNGSITHIKKNTEFILSRGTDTLSMVSCVLLNDTRLKANRILFSTSASHTIVKDNFTNCSNVNMLISNTPISDNECDKNHGGTPHINNPNIVLKGEQIMNLFLPKIPDLTKSPAEFAKGNPELYYDTGRFIAEFTIIEKK